MLKLKRFILATAPRNAEAVSILTKRHSKDVFPEIPSRCPSQLTSARFLDIYQDSKDEMNRGYFADMSEMNKHGGKISTANKILIPAMGAVKFPKFEVNYSDGSSLNLPIIADVNDTNASKSKIPKPKAALLCLSFRASSQSMVNSWSLPFLHTFSESRDAQLYEVSFIDSWLLTRSPIKKLLLKIMRKSKPEESKGVLQRQVVYSFGDHYYLRKDLKILNLLTGYVFLVDKFGRIRWQGSGSATEEELSSLLSCSSQLLEE